METSAQTDNASIEALDFELTCRVVVAPKLNTSECGRKATWMVTLPCCGHQNTSCDGHKYTDRIGPGSSGAAAICKGCGTRWTSAETWTWNRI